MQTIGKGNYEKEMTLSFFVLCFYGCSFRVFALGVSFSRKTEQGKHWGFYAVKF